MGTHSQRGSHHVSGASTFFAEHGYLEVPSLVQWMATLHCGLSCAHCLAVSHESGFADMPIEKVRGLIDEVAAMGVAEFLVTGGEPLARADLSDVIAHLGRRQVNWTLNTAALPDRPLREAIAANKPGFVAVSLDGPREMHDGFRGKTGAYNEALEAIRFFKSLEGVRVCAGTTVTSRNYDHLDETFHLVAASGADQWGIHLLVPEGRAAQRPDLFLSKAQLKRLIKFVARKRRYFPVAMADEIGYLGYLEPLVRDVPLTCGAGRSQCVVLPDGAVVPCTTLDRSCSAGNVHERSLAEIWTAGFKDLRVWRPTGKCGRCDYAIACRGGCWLQRKAGKQCFKDVWHVPGALKTAAGVAICLGGLAVTPGPSVASATPAFENPALQTPFRAAATTELLPTTDPLYLDEAILRFYTEMAAGLDAGSYTTWRDPWNEVDCNDAACQFFADFTQGTLPEDMTERCLIVRGALDTEHRSLSLIALLWRAICGPLFEADNPSEYSEAERQILRDTLATLKEKADAWRLEIFADSLDAYLQRGRFTPHGPCTKAGPDPGDEEKRKLQRDLDEERWGVSSDPESNLTEERTLLEREAATAYLQEHHYADQMNLIFTFSGTGSLVKHSARRTETLSFEVDGIRTGEHMIGVFDEIEIVSFVKLAFQIKGRFIPKPRFDADDRVLLDDYADEYDLSSTQVVYFRDKRTYTYLELLNEIHQQCSGLPTVAHDWLCGTTVRMWNHDTTYLGTVHQNGALLWPAFREMIETGTTVLSDESRNPIEAPLSDRDLNRAILKEIDFWMF